MNKPIPDQKISIDTNILIYALDVSDKKKHNLAIKVLEQVITKDCILTLQVLCEYYNTITRKNLLAADIAQSRVNELQSVFPVVNVKISTLSSAIDVTSSDKLSFWDAMLWATVREAGVTILLTEYFQHERVLQGVRFINPFIANNYWTVTE